MYVNASEWALSLVEYLFYFHWRIISRPSQFQVCYEEKEEDWSR